MCSVRRGSKPLTLTSATSASASAPTLTSASRSAVLCPLHSYTNAYLAGVHRIRECVRYARFSVLGTKAKQPKLLERQHRNEQPGGTIPGNAARQCLVAKWPLSLPTVCSKVRGRISRRENSLECPARALRFSQSVASVARCEISALCFLHRVFRHGRRGCLLICA